MTLSKIFFFSFFALFLLSSVFALSNLNQNLFNALQKNDFTYAETLLQKGANINYIYDSGLGLLHYAVAENNYKEVDFLLSHNADIDLLNTAGESPLFVTVSKCNFKMAKYLLQRNADFTIVDKYNHDVRYYALQNQCYNIVNYLDKVNNFDFYNTQTNNVLESQPTTCLDLYKPLKDFVFGKKMQIYPKKERNSYTYSIGVYKIYITTKNKKDYIYIGKNDALCNIESYVAYNLPNNKIIKVIYDKSQPIIYIQDSVKENGDIEPEDWVSHSLEDNKNVAVLENTKSYDKTISLFCYLKKPDFWPVVYEDYLQSQKNISLSEFNKFKTFNDNKLDSFNIKFDTNYFLSVPNDIYAKSYWFVSKKYDLFLDFAKNSFKEGQEFYCYNLNNNINSYLYLKKQYNKLFMKLIDVSSYILDKNYKLVAMGNYNMNYDSLIVDSPNLLNMNYVSENIVNLKNKIKSALEYKTYNWPILNIDEFTGYYKNYNVENAKDYKIVYFQDKQNKNKYFFSLFVRGKTNITLKEKDNAYKYITENNLLWPTISKHIASCFGARKNVLHRCYSQTLNHEGIDIEARFGDPVYAVADGTVIMQNQNGFGSLAIDHGNFYSRYLHMYKVFVRKGDNVKKGQLIGQVGGKIEGKLFKTFPHLHFEIAVKHKKEYGNDFDKPIPKHNEKCLCNCYLNQGCNDICDSSIECYRPKLQEKYIYNRYLSYNQNSEITNINPICFYKNNFNKIFYNKHSKACFTQGGLLKWCDTYVKDKIKLTTNKFKLGYNVNLNKAIVSTINKEFDNVKKNNFGNEQSIDVKNIYAFDKNYYYNLSIIHNTTSDKVVELMKQVSNLDQQLLLASQKYNKYVKHTFGSSMLPENIRKMFVSYGYDTSERVMLLAFKDYLIHSKYYAKCSNFDSKVFDYKSRYCYKNRILMRQSLLTILYKNCRFVKGISKKRFCFEHYNNVLNNNAYLVLENLENYNTNKLFKLLSENLVQYKSNNEKTNFGFS